MNRALASTLSAINGLVALVIVLVGAVAGYGLAGQSAAGALVGAIGGFVIAAVSCGVIAYLTLIERHLAQIAGQPLSRSLVNIPKADNRIENPKADNRIEPTL
ncbi:hypothetical protein VQ042_22420 [Aurantimonas sp. A2-1-M11]|uniref:hypothetical protein n=1 Tax=Aurantimonas sp. A2-1-M11 TaxID=3113712 RepID=UPI002F933443